MLVVEAAHVPNRHNGHSSVGKRIRKAAWLIALLFAVPAMLASFSTVAIGAVTTRQASHTVPAYCHTGGQILWDHLVTCGWPGESNTGPVLADCPGDHLVPQGNGTNPIVLSTPNQVIKCADLLGQVSIRAANVTIINSA